ncbi:Hypothetical protein FKW44_003561 [Caligus rogercresseyi]|uniref:Uncharacterized protein n=1 Tax=Caligus rogercresseyi TaxID=217165 RepID=A0A7T8QX15_CALRO|nr:Hypothetical protein FKW44_003561 [Caligus rogercresseyi]
MSMEDRESLLEEHLPLASTRYSEYEKAFANCRVGLLRLNALLRKMEKHLNNATNSAFEVKLFFAKLSRAKEEVKDLRSLTDLASQYWYNIGDEPSVMAFIDASDRLEE